MRWRALTVLVCLAMVPGVRSDNTKVADLIRQLGSDAYTEREAASRALEALEAALEAVQKAALESPDAEVRSRARKVMGVLVARARARALLSITDRGGRVQFSGSEDFDEELNWLSLTGTKTTDADLVWVKWLDELRTLNLNGTAVTDVGLRQVKHLRRLEGLQLMGTQVTDAGLKELTDLKRLQWLDLSGTTVSDAGLEHLKTLTNLSLLVLSDTRVTAEGIANLKKARPKLSVVEP